MNPRPTRVLRIFDIAWAAAERFVAHEGFELSGYAAFTALLSLFPFLLFLTALAGFLGDAGLAERLLALAFDFVPPGVVETLRPVIFDVLTQQHEGLLTVGIVFALWSASSGLEALRTVLNRSYGIAETRQIWTLRPQSVLIVIVSTAAATIVSGAIIFGPVLLKFLRWLLANPHLSDAAWVALRYGLAAVVVTGGLMSLHLTLPNARLSIRTVWPGAVASALLWLGGASLFTLYVDNFADFSLTYGSLGGIILTLLFFYFTATLIAYGAELNAALRAAAASP
jgi:membrane protein